MKNIFRKTPAVMAALIVMLSLALSGCASKDPVAGEVLASTMTAMEKISSYDASLNMTMDMTASGSGETQTTSISASGTSRADVLKKNLYMLMDMGLTMPGSNDQKITLEMYNVDGWQYLKTVMGDSAAPWTKKQITDTLTKDQTAQLTDLMKTSTAASLEGSEKINGKDCYILKITPDMNALWQWMISQQGTELSQLFDSSNLDLTKLIKDFGIKYWIDKKSRQMVKVESNMTMNFDATSLGLSADSFDSMVMAVNLDMNFSNYNTPVNIQIPQDALNAADSS